MQLQMIIQSEVSSQTKTNIAWYHLHVRSKTQQKSAHSRIRHREQTCAFHGGGKREGDGLGIWSQVMQTINITVDEWRDPSVELYPTSRDKPCMLSHFSRVWLFVTLWTVAHQALLPMWVSRQEYWSGLPFPCPNPNRKNKIWRKMYIGI